MTRHALGIDIGEAQVSGVALTRQGRSLQLTGCCRVELAADTDPAGVAAAVRQVGAQLGGPQAVTVLGLPLSRLSVRNLALPFKDARSITQTLPFELEEQLLVPVDSQVSDFLLAGSTPDGGSRVIAFSAEQELLAGLLGGLEGRPDPGVITPTGLALAAAVARDNPPGRPLLLVHLELPAATLVLVDGPVPVLCRRLPWGEPPLLPRTDGDSAEADTSALNPEALRLLAAAVERTIDLYAQESGAPMQPEGVVLTGPLAELDRDSGLLAAFLGVSTQVADLVQTAGATCAAPAEDSGRGRYDAALALALTGLEKRPGINLRRGPFARPRSLFTSRKRLVAAGAAEINLADTAGKAGPDDVVRLVGRVRRAVAVPLSLHLHGPRERALANLLAGYRAGVRLFDVALGGLGGCPFVPGAGGNVATEEAAERFASLGVPTGLDVQALAAAADHTARLLGRPLHPPSGRGSD